MGCFFFVTPLLQSPSGMNFFCYTFVTKSEWIVIRGNHPQVVNGAPTRATSLTGIPDWARKGGAARGHRFTPLTGMSDWPRRGGDGCKFDQP